MSTAPRLHHDDGVASSPPRSEDAERATLAAMLMSVAAIGTVSTVLEASDFADPRHRLLFTAMQRLHEDGAPIDPITLADALEQRGDLAGAGGKEYLGGLLDEVPTAANVAYHARIVLEHAQRRALVGAFRRALLLAEQPGTAPSALAAEVRAALAPLEATAGGWSEGSSSRRPLVLKRLLEGEPPAPPALSIERFLLAADVNCLGAMGDAGKSTTIFTAAVCTATGRPLFGTLAITRPGPVVLVVPEDGEAVARHHVDAVAAGMELSDVERAVLTRDLHIIGDDRRFNLLTDTAELAALCAPIRPALIALDPVASLLGAESENDERVAEIACANLRRDLARPFGAAILLAAHLRKPSRENGATGAATIHDLKGSAGWANHARVVWLLDKPKGSNLITYRLQKSNRLPTGIEHQVVLSIEANPDNAAHWLTLRLTDANLGAASQSFTPGKGRALNENERKALAVLDDCYEPGARHSHSRWLAESGILSPGTFRSVKDRLLAAGLALAEPTSQRNNNGKSPVRQYGITDEGRSVLNRGHTEP